VYPDPSKVRLLLVDDMKDTRENIKKLLSFEEDIEVAGEAAEGFEALDRYEELVPDVVCMNINIPKMDGITVTKRLCARHPDANVFILSSLSGFDSWRLAVRAGVWIFFLFHLLFHFLLLFPSCLSMLIFSVALSTVFS